MQRQQMKSSNIRSVGYDAAGQTLEVEFLSGKVYRYAGVPPETANALLKARSVGAYFAEHVRPHFTGEPVAS